MPRTAGRVAALVTAALVAALVGALAPIDAAQAGPPDTTITAGPEDGDLVLPGPVQYSFTSDVGGATFECQVDSGAFAACTSPVTYDLATGGHTFTVRAVDNLMQPDPVPAFRRWTVRNVPCEQAGAAYRNAQGEFFFHHTHLGETKTKLQRAKAKDQAGKVKRLKKKVKKLKEAVAAAEAAMNAALAQEQAVC